MPKTKKRNKNTDLLFFFFAFSSAHKKKSGTPKKEKEKGNPPKKKKKKGIPKKRKKKRKKKKEKRKKEKKKKMQERDVIVVVVFTLVVFMIVYAVIARTAPTAAMLGEDTEIIAVMSPTCPHCIRAKRDITEAGDSGKYLYLHPRSIYENDELRMELQSAGYNGSVPFFYSTRKKRGVTGYRPPHEIIAALT
jgi:glutaredoxin